MTCSDIKEQLFEDINRPDKFWREYTFYKDAKASALSQESKEELIEKSIQTALDIYKKYVKDYAGCSLEEWLAQLSLQVEHRYFYEQYEIQKYIALYVPSERTIVLQHKALNKVHEFIMQNDLCSMFSMEEIRCIAIYHEIFHHIETITPGIFTASNMIKKRFFLTFSYHTCCSAASEVAAVEFSRLMSQSGCHPCVYERLFNMALSADVLN
ncbi:hypothetical protein [Lacrimispora aerotolerans]|uniref:hypothetical protein n=1 Tax=Lacrimispora aerotolerans TaxID=36832 RepID=UPI0004796F89|nr:hypothetical protein [Lacrimispora aerotolerans]